MSICKHLKKYLTIPMNIYWMLTSNEFKPFYVLSHSIPTMNEMSTFMDVDIEV
jgi:hypothetical protein